MNFCKSITTMARALFTVVAAVVVSAAASADTLSNLEVRYRLDEGSGSTATDSSTNTGRNGTVNGGNLNTTGRVGGAVHLDGTDDYIDGPAIGNTDSAQRLTVAFWLNTDTRNDSEILVSKFAAALNQFSISLGTSGTGDENDIVVFIGTTSLTAGSVYTTGDVLSDSRWIHVAVVYDGTLSGDTNQCKIYINGIQQTGTQIGSSGDIPATLLNSSSDHWYIGWRDDQPTGLSLDGKVDEFQLYTRALSASDVMELYLQTEGSILFNAALANPNSKLENTTADVLAGSDELTICAWVNAAGFGQNGDGTVIRFDETSDTHFLRHPNAANKLTWIASFSSSYGEWTFPITDGQWQAVALTHDQSPASNTPRARVNYLDVTVTRVSAVPTGDPVVVPAGYCVGNNSATNETWNGKIAHVQVFNRVLSPTEMDAALRNPGSIKHGLRLWLPMLNASDVNDRSGYGFHGTGTALETGSDGPPYDTRYAFGVTNETRRTIEIGNSGIRGVRGQGIEATKLTADARVTARFITTANYPNTAVDSATVARLTFDGNQISTDAFPNVGHPMSGEWLQAEVANGVELLAYHARITDCRIRGFRGDGARIKRPAPDLAQFGVFQQIDNCEIVQNYIGVHVTSADQRVFQNMIANSRDAGLRIDNDCGNVQTANNHVFGAYRAYENLGGDGGKHVNDYYADAYRGIHINFNSNENHFTNCMVQRCTEEAVYIAGSRNSFTNCRFECAQSSQDWPNAIGLELDHIADFTRFTGCQFGVNYWQNGNDTGHTAAVAAIYFHLDPAPDDGVVYIDLVTISGTAYTVFQRTGDVLLRFDTTSDQVRSLTVDLQVEGFDDPVAGTPLDKLIVADADTVFRDCRLVFRGNFGGNLVPGDVFDLPTAWNGATGSEEGNSITVYDTYDGDVHALDMNATY
jgi:hypothetical protein